MSSFGERVLNVFQTRGQLCIGLDPSSQQLSSWNLPDSAQGARTFGYTMLDVAEKYVGIVKPQVAFFEQFGPEGLEVLVEILEQAQSRQLLVIADAKRGDIGSTMAAYSRAWLAKDAVFACDALTVSPYLGAETLNASVEAALENNRGLFVLAATSNPEAFALQSSQLNSQSVAASVIEYAASHSDGQFGSIGAVLGATVEFEQLGISLGERPTFPVLVPGFGAQGSKLSEAGDLLEAYASRSICSVSRSVAGDSKEGLEDRVSMAKSQLEIGLRS